MADEDSRTERTPPSDDSGEETFEEPLADASALRRLLGDRDFRSAVDDYERDLIVGALDRADGHQTRAAALLGVLPTTLSSKIKRLENRGLRVRPNTSDDTLTWRLALVEGVLEVAAPGAHVDVESADEDAVSVEVRFPRSTAPTPEVRLVRNTIGARLDVSHATASVTIRVRLPRGVRLRTAAADPVSPLR